MAIGALAGHDNVLILGRALAVMLMGWLVGRLIGGMAQRTVEAHVRDYRQAHPVPDPLARTQTADPSTAEGKDGRP